MNNQSSRNNNQIIINHQIPITKSEQQYVKKFILGIGICLVIVSWSLIITSFAYASEDKFFEIKAKKFSYTPHIIKVNKGDLVKIRLVSEDVTHGLFIDGYGQNTKAHPGEEGYLEFIADKPGRFSFRCSVTCGEFHPYMIGYLVVEPNLRFLFYLLMVIFIGLALFLFINFKKKEERQSSESNEQQ